MKHFSFPIFLLYATAVLPHFSFSQTPAWEWAIGMGAQNSESFQAITVDHNGQIICGGTFENTVDFDPGPAVANLTATNNDGVVAKYDQDGNYLWSFKLSGWAYDDVMFVQVDALNNVYVSGHFRGQVDFNPGPGTFNLTSPNDQQNSYLMKVDANGNFLWAKMYHATNGVTNKELVVDQNTGDVYFAGYYYATVDMDPGTGVVNAFNAGSEDFFISKLDTDGNFIRGVRFGDVSTQNINALVIRPENGNLILGGHFYGSFDSDPSIDSTRTITTTQAGTADGFVIQLDSAFNWVWTRQLAGQYNQILYDLSYTPSNGGHIAMTGWYASAMDADPGESEYILEVMENSNTIFIADWTVDGEFNWAKSLGSPTSNETGNEVLYDAHGNLYATGTFPLSMDLDPGNGELIVNVNTSNTGAYIIKLHAGGDFLWGHHIADYPTTIGPFIANSQDNKLFIAGAFGNDAVVYGNNTLEHEGNSDLLVGRIGCENNTFTEVHACSSYTLASGTIVTENGLYGDTLINVSGCDSISGIQLFIHQPDDISFAIQSCEEYILPSGADTLYMSGVYEDVLTNQYGCDSILTITVDIIPEIHASIQVDACVGYMSPDGTTYWTLPGIYQDTLASQFGCDSIITVDLDLLNTFAAINVSDCSQWISPDGLETWTESGVYNDTLINAAGCDSIILVNVQILSNSLAIDMSACESYTSPSGEYVWTESGIYSDTLTNILGCDSILTIDLTVVDINTTITQTENWLVCGQEDAGYQWLDCTSNSTPIAGETDPQLELTENGSYAVVINYEGCTATSACFEVTNIGIDEFVNSKRFLVYPMPVEEVFNWTPNVDVEWITLTCADGRVLATEKVQTNSWQRPPNIPSGIYALTCYTRDQVWTARVILK